MRRAWRSVRKSLGLVPPAPLPRRFPPGRQAVPWANVDRWSSHPGYGATVEGVVSIYRGAEAGWLARQADLFDDLIESDGHLRSLIESRIAAVAGKEWVIQPGGPDDASVQAAAELEAVLRDNLNFHEFLEHQLTAPYYGYAASEIDWRLVEGRVVPGWFANAPHARFVLDDDNQLRLSTERGKTEGEPLVPGKWVVTRMRHRNLARAGLLRTAGWWAVFKRASVRDWMIFADKFGIPVVAGFYGENTPEAARDALEEAVKDIGEGGAAVLHEATRIEVQQIAVRGGDVTALHPGVVALCEAQMSKLINGATQNVEMGTAGSYAQAQVHQARAFDLVLGDAMRLSHAFRQHVGVPFLRYNGIEGARAPRLHVRVVQEMSATERVDIASKLANDLGASLDGAQLLDELGFRKPARPEDALTGTKGKSAEKTDDEPEEPDEPSR